MLPLPGLSGWEYFGPPQTVQLDPLSCELLLGKNSLDEAEPSRIHLRGVTLSLQRREDGISLVHPAGIWSCSRMPDGSLLESPAGRWRLERRGDRVAVSGPGGTDSSLWLEEGRLVGWQDPGGSRTGLERDREGRIIRVEAPGGPAWNLGWEGSRLSWLEREDGARWTLGQTAVEDPTGRSFPLRRNSAGLAEAGGWYIRGDRYQDAMGRELRLLRDPQGRVVEIHWAGGQWRLGRDAEGQLSAFTDPAGLSWRLRWSSGRLEELFLPDGRSYQMDWTAAGLLSRLQKGGQSWSFQYQGSRLESVRNPEGAEQRLDYDATGRLRGLRRADGSTLSVQTDGRGELTAVEGVQIRRDAAGRPLRLELEGKELVWYRDGAGQLVVAEGPGLRLVLGRDGAGRVIRVGELGLQRDGQGRVVEAGGWKLERDLSGRILARQAPDGRRLEIRRDPRGREELLVLPEGEWKLRRDSAGRLLQVQGPGVQLGMDRDQAGRPSLFRYPSLLLRALWRTDGVDFSEEEGSGFGWKLDGQGRLLSRSDGRRLHYDPLGGLSTREDAEDGWVLDPGGISGPAESRLDLDAEGRPLRGRLPGKGWGLKGTLAWELGPGGRVEQVSGSNGSVSLLWDSLGRLQAWVGTGGKGQVERDPFGGLVSLGGQPAEGWERALWWKGALAAEPGLAWAAPSGLGLLDQSGEPMLLRGELLSDGQGRLNGPLGLRIGLLESMDPIAGCRLGPGMPWPWRRHSLVPEPQWDAPWPDPDRSAPVAWWNPAPWEPHSAWGDPLALLVEIGELPQLEAIVPAESGLSWFAERQPVPALFRARPVPGLQEDMLTERLITRSVGDPLQLEEPLLWVLEEVLQDWPALPELEGAGGW